MPATNIIPPRVLELLRCQQTLQPLVQHEQGLYSEAADLLYPVQNGLVFMGYDERERDFLETVMEEERVFQTSAQNFERDLAFLKTTSVATVDLVNLVDKVVGLDHARLGLELGAANGWVSWLFAEAGVDMWMCELEANSLALGWAFGHPNLGVGKRIVSDATLVPFAAGTFDLVVCKEFAHHVKDKARLFAEANRVLRPGGALVLMEPVRSLATTYYNWRHPDPHTDHAIVWPEQYLRAIQSRGFSIPRQGSYFYGRPGRIPLTAWIKRRANSAVRRGQASHDLISWVYEHLVGASLVVLALKQHDIPQPPRPRIRVVSPARLHTPAPGGPDYGLFLDILQQAAGGLASRPAVKAAVAHH